MPHPSFLCVPQDGQGRADKADADAAFEQQATGSCTNLAAVHKATDAATSAASGSGTKMSDVSWLWGFSLIETGGGPWVALSIPQATGAIALHPASLACRWLSRVFLRRVRCASCIYMLGVD